MLDYGPLRGPVQYIIFVAELERVVYNDGWIVLWFVVSHDSMKRDVNIYGR